MAYRSGLSRERGRRRRRVLWRGMLWLAVAAVLGAIGYSSYRTGSTLARLEVTTAEENVARLTAELGNLRSENDRLRTDLAQTRQNADTLRRRYDADVPKGGLAEVLGLARDRLAAGVPQDRIAQVLREAEAMQPCESRVSRKRFAMQTTGQGPDQVVSLLDGLIQVTVSVPAGAEDPTKAATVTITRAWASQPIKATGLPVRQSIAINNVELKLTVEVSEMRGYGAVSLSTCGKG